MVMHNVDILKDQNFDYIVTPCSSCTVAIREFWAQFSNNLPPRYRDAINALAPKAIDINALLVDVLHISPSAGQGADEGDVSRILPPPEVPWREQQPRDLIRMNGIQPRGNGRSQPLLRLRGSFTADPL